ncbi:MAG TPA: ChbG/HpnK family deacetylase [Phycisphaerae bacterium]|nr:ChbG/HpnK family deacetylase [Phycisphaerae bacterium]
MQVKVVINADDLGFSQGVTDGILRAHHQGILTSATLMTTMPDRDRAIDLAKSTPALGVGIHLCLNQGTTCSGKLQYLCNNSDVFDRRISRLLWRLTVRPKCLEEVKREWAEQIKYALDRGIKPTHLDSHKHVYNIPSLGKIAIALALEFGIPGMRCAAESHIVNMPAPGLGRRIVSGCARKLKSQMNAAGLKTTDWFYGLASTGRMSSITWLKLLDALPEGIGEVMVHPGYAQGLTLADTYLIKQRQTELDALCDPAVKRKIQSKGVQTIHYGQID